MHKHSRGIGAGWASIPVQRKTPIQSLLNFLFLNTLEVP